jgi:hypothetical protein
LSKFRPEAGHRLFITDITSGEKKREDLKLKRLIKKIKKHTKENNKNVK